MKNKKLLISKLKHKNYNFVFDNPIQVEISTCDRGQVKYSNEYFEVHARGINEKVALTNFKLNFITAYRIYKYGYFYHLAPSLQELQRKFTDDVVDSKRAVKDDICII